MKVVIAPDSFKGSLSALEAATAMAAGVRDVYPTAEISLIPLADGGEGTVDALVAAVPGSAFAECEVYGPLGEPVVARYGLLGKERSTAVVEMAAASGLTLIPTRRRNVMRATTYGTGQLIRCALTSAGVSKLVIGVGGSATNDGGAGALAALGIVFIDSSGQTNNGLIGAVDLPRLVSLDASGALKTDAEVIIACDVTNPMVGPNGASAVFGPQKGATPQMIATLDSSLVHFAGILDQMSAATGNADRTSAESFAARAGGGAAGGLAAGLMALFPQAVMRSGVDIVLDTAQFDSRIADADLVITGEGKLDEQTLSGKTICGVLRRSQPANIRTIALAGSVDPNAAQLLRDRGLESAHGIIDLAENLDDAITRGPALLRELAATVMRNAFAA